MKTAVLSLIGIALLLSIAPATTFATSPWTSELVWGNGTVYQMLAPPGHGSQNTGNLEPLYIVAPQTSTPQSPANNDHLPGVAHDHVLDPQSAGHSNYNPNWEVYLVGCAPESGACTFVMVDLTAVGGPSSFPLALSFNGHALTSDSAIEAGVAAHALFEVDSGIHFICIVVAVK